MAATPQIKGFAIRGILKYVKEAGLEGGIPAILEKLPAEERSLFGEPVITSAWYPYPMLTSLLRVVDRETGRGDLTHLTTVGEFSGRQDAGSIFKIVMALSSVERVVAAAPRFWKRYCDTGWFEVLEVTPGTLHVVLRDFPDVDEAHCALITGWMKGLGETAGARDGKVTHTSCIHRGDRTCEYRATWS